MIDVTTPLVKWVIRIIYIFILVLVFFVGILLSYLGSYDVTAWDGNKALVINVANQDYGPTALYYTNISYSGVLGVNCSVNGMKAIAGFEDQSANQVIGTYLAAGNGITWYGINMASTQYLVVGLVVTTINTQQPYTIMLYSTKDLRAVPRVIGPIVWVVLFALCIVWEWRLYVYTKKYGAGSENDTKATRRKTRFFSKN